jgi:hypothetical protein
MNTMVLMAFSLVGVITLFAALAFYLLALIRVLGAVGGGPTSLLAKIRMGVRAIETETGALAPEVTQLNEGLASVSTGLGRIGDNLTGVIDAVGSQKEG